MDLGTVESGSTKPGLLGYLAVSLNPRIVTKSQR